MIFRISLLALAAFLSSTPLLAKQTLPPQITQAIKSWQQCAATAYTAQRQVNADRDLAAEASFAACKAQFETVVARADDHTTMTGPSAWWASRASRGWVCARAPVRTI